MDKTEQNYKKSGTLKSIHAYISRNKIGEIMVMKGIISPSDLRQALINQKETGSPLGRILVESKLVSKKQLSTVLVRQKILRFVASAIMCCVSITGVSRKSRAEIADIPAKISITQVSYQGNKISKYPSLFGSAEKKSNNLSAFTKWSDMFARFDKSLGSASSQKIIRKMMAELQTYKDLPLRNMAEKINTMMNKKRYIVDSKNWGKSDYWETPIEFMKYGGDCEDFAIAKYVALRTLGVSEERMRIAVVQDLVKNTPHAVLVLYTNNGAVILDNQQKRVMNASALRTRYRPIFSINRQAWWLHTVPTTTMVASAR